MRVNLAYGRGHLGVDFPEALTTVIEPAFIPGLPDERAAVLQALEHPVAARPLREWLKPSGRVCIAFTDQTRATPNDRLLPWILEALPDVPAENITLLNSTGTHRANTPAELEQMLGPDLARKYRVINHDCQDPEQLIALGVTGDGTPALLNRHFVSADVRIVTGFIEPHFFAGFSGGPKGIMPGVAGLRTVMSNHGSRNLSHPDATFGMTRGNPLWEELRDIALRAGPSFLVNVTLNERRQITGVFAGDLLAAHRKGCEHVRQSAMRCCEAPFDLVVTTNSGYPLDLNLYQGVKGLSAAARIVKPGGTIILACECSQGVPAGSPYDHLLRSRSAPEEVLASMAVPGFCEAEQWQVQIQLQIQSKARVLLHSSLADEAVRAAHLLPCHDIRAEVAKLCNSSANPLRLAVIPQGPLTIPYLA